jgi:hypothetical protein
MKVNPIVAIGFFILIGILIIALARGCRRNEIKPTIDIESRVEKLKQDSIENTRQLAAYEDTMTFMEGQLSLSHNKEIALNENLDKANDRISILLRKHVPIKPSLSDTGIITVPMRFVNECADCFIELDSGQKLVRKYKSEKDNQEKIYKGQLSLKDNRISNLEKSNNNLTAGYKSLLDSTKRVQDVLKPRGRLYLSWGVLWKEYVPWSAGGGLMYQTPRNLIIGAKWYYNAHGHMVETNVNFPLSLRFK